MVWNSHRAEIMTCLMRVSHYIWTGNHMLLGKSFVVWPEAWPGHYRLRVIFSPARRCSWVTEQTCSKVEWWWNPSRTLSFTTWCVTWSAWNLPLITAPGEPSTTYCTHHLTCPHHLRWVAPMAWGGKVEQYWTERICGGGRPLEGATDACRDRHSCLGHLPQLGVP